MVPFDVYRHQLSLDHLHYESPLGGTLCDLQADILFFLNGHQAIEPAARHDQFVSPCSPEAGDPPVGTR